MTEKVSKSYTYKCFVCAILLTILLSQSVVVGSIISFSYEARKVVDGVIGDVIGGDTIQTTLDWDLIRAGDLQKEHEY